MSNVKEGDLAKIISPGNRGKLVLVGKPVTEDRVLHRCVDGSPIIYINTPGKLGWHIEMLGDYLEVVTRTSKRHCRVGPKACILDEKLKRIDPPEEEETRDEKLTAEV